jgi:hypothetical protein
MIDEAFEVATTHDLINANEQIKYVFKFGRIAKTREWAVPAEAAPLAGVGGHRCRRKQRRILSKFKDKKNESIINFSDCVYFIMYEG